MSISSSVLYFSFGKYWVSCCDDLNDLVVSGDPISAYTVQVVAVKQLDRNGLQGHREFLVESSSPSKSGQSNWLMEIEGFWYMNLCHWAPLKTYLYLVGCTIDGTPQNSCQ
ncbi:hypothetical protein CKAN_02698900 [Cinnamomum micranthum f. kanehirae]|uniref:Uncharacterized protein n=1 Tax=Cinnamomum micranthum f. kanehirae TaxID=337451 RepID=A0A3S3NS25_9MAGN|nr:hypothetical protein CKAN_02698900 [Cinnamomum micranthum f. kanehirae]